MANWVHNGLTVYGDSIVLRDLAEKVLDVTNEIAKTSDNPSQLVDEIYGIYKDGLKDNKKSYMLHHGTLQEIVHSSKEYEEYREVLDPMGVLVDFDPTMHIETDLDKLITSITFTFDTKWNNQNTLFSIALLELASTLDEKSLAVDGKSEDCYIEASGSEELLQFENSCIVVNKLKVNNDVVVGPRVLYQSYTNRNQLIREELKKEIDLQTFDIVSYENIDPDLIAEEIVEHVLSNTTLEHIEWSAHKVKNDKAVDNLDDCYLITFKASSLQLLAGAFYSAIAKFGYSIYTEEYLEKYPFKAVPQFQLTGQFTGNTVPVKFKGLDTPTFVYGENNNVWYKINSGKYTSQIDDGDAPF